MLMLSAFRLQEGDAGSASLVAGETKKLDPISEFGANPYTEEEEKSLSVNGGVKFGHCGGAKVGQFGASALERAALI